VKSDSHDIFIERFPRRYPKGHPGFVEPPIGPPIPGAILPAHLNAVTGEEKNSAKRRNAWVVRRVDDHDRAHERGVGWEVC
jgi:hypothetical protein